MPADSARNRFIRVASELLDANPRVAIVLADIGVDRFVASGAFRRHPARVVNVGIREQLMVSVAAGMALEGLRPIAHSYAPFLVERAFEQVKLGFSHQGVGGVLVSVGASYDGAESGRTHQSPADVALVASLPGWRIEVPGHPDEAEAALRRAVATDTPVYIRLSEETNSRAEVGADGELRVCRKGSPGAPTIVAVGPTFDAVIEGTSELDVTVVYASTVRPFDREGLRAAAKGVEVVLVEPYLEGTSAAEIAAALADRPHRLLAIGVPNVEHRHYGTSAEHRRAYCLDADGIGRRIRSWLARA